LIIEEVVEIDPSLLFKGENDELFSLPLQWKQFITMQVCAPYAAMLLVQFAYGGSNILMKIALEKGLNQIVFVVYRHLIAMILLGPFAYVIER
jgi:hypothetical protein